MGGCNDRHPVTKCSKYGKPRHNHRIRQNTKTLIQTNWCSFILSSYARICKQPYAEIFGFHSLLITKFRTTAGCKFDFGLNLAGSFWVHRSQNRITNPKQGWVVNSPTMIFNISHYMNIHKTQIWWHEDSKANLKVTLRKYARGSRESQTMNDKVRQWILTNKFSSTRELV